jgi:small subunit ribosomal protein S3Ae
MTKDYMRSLVKRRTSKIGANIVVTTKDGCKLRVKPLIFTVKRARTSQIESIRKIMVDVISKKSKDLSFNDCVTEIVNGKMAAEVYKATKNIYPLRRVEVAKSEVVSKPAVQASAPAAAAAPVTAPVPAAEPAAEPKE